MGEAAAVARVWQALDASGADGWHEAASEWREVDALELRVPVMGSQPEVTLVSLTPTANPNPNPYPLPQPLSLALPKLTLNLTLTPNLSLTR